VDGIFLAKVSPELRKLERRDYSYFHGAFILKLGKNKMWKLLNKIVISAILFILFEAQLNAVEIDTLQHPPPWDYVGERIISFTPHTELRTQLEVAQRLRGALISKLLERSDSICIYLSKEGDCLVFPVTLLNRCQLLVAKAQWIKKSDTINFIPNKVIALKQMPDTILVRGNNVLYLTNSTTYKESQIIHEIANLLNTIKKKKYYSILFTLFIAFVVIYYIFSRIFAKVSGRLQHIFIFIFSLALSVVITDFLFVFADSYGRKQVVVCDSLEQIEYDSIWCLTVSQDGKNVAYLALRRRFVPFFSKSKWSKKWSVCNTFILVYNNREILIDSSGRYVEISNFCYDWKRGNFAICAQKKNGEYFIITKKSEYGPFEYASSPCFNQVGDLAFNAKDENGYFVSVNGIKSSERFDTIGSITSTSKEFFCPIVKKSKLGILNFTYRHNPGTIDSKSNFLPFPPHFLTKLHKQANGYILIQGKTAKKHIVIIDRNLKFIYYSPRLYDNVWVWDESLNYSIGKVAYLAKREGKFLLVCEKIW
jgi:hypothetical protein